MRKSLSVILSTAIAFSSFSAIGLAASIDDFKDLKDVDNASKTKYDYLIKQGIFNGVSTSNFGLKDEMTRAQFSKVASLIFGYNANTTLKTSSFKDVKSTDAANAYAIGYIEAIKNAGITKGITATEFNPSGKVTKEQLATFLIRGLGKESELDSTTPVTDASVSEWAKKYVALALKYNLMTKEKNGSFGGTSNATRETLALAAYDTKMLNDDIKSGVIKISEANVTGAKKLTVKFNKAVDTAKATLEIKNLNSVVNILKTNWSEDKKSVDLDFANTLSESEYTINVKGITSDVLTINVKVSSEKIQKITINDKAPLINNAEANKISVGYKVVNQYNEDISDSVSDLILTSSSGTIDTALSKPGMAVISLPTGSRFTIGDKVTFSILQKSTAMYTTATTTVSSQAMVDSIEIQKVYNADSKKILAANSLASEFKLLINAKDQYGNAVDASKFGTETYLTITNPLVLNVVRDSSNNPIYSSTTVDGIKYISLQLKKSTNVGTTDDFTAGKSTVSIVSFTGKTARLEVTVNEVLKVDRLAFSTPNLAVAGESFTVPFTAYSANGEVITDYNALTSSITSLYTSDNLAKALFVYDSATSKTQLIVTPDPAKFTAHNFTIYAITNSGKSFMQSVNVGKKAEPTVISGFKADDLGRSFNDAQLLNSKQTLSLDQVIVNDQYGRKISPIWGTIDNTYSIKVDSSSPSNIASSKTSLSTSTDSADFTANAKGSSDITLTLQVTKSVNGTSTASAVPNSQLSKSIRVVEKSSITKYEFGDVTKLYQYQDTFNTATNKAVTDAEVALYTKNIIIYGLIDNNKKVEIPSSEYSLGSTLIKNNVLNAIHGTAITDGKDKSANLIATIKADKGQTINITKEIVYSNEVPVVKTFQLLDSANVNNTTANKVGADSVSVAVTGGNDNTKVTALAKAIVKAVDQYGVTLTDTKKFDNNKIEITQISGGKAIAAVGAGDSYNVTVHSPNYGATLTFKVVLK